MRGTTHHLRVLLVAVMLAAPLSLSVGPATATPNYDWPGMKKCGTFRAEYRIWVYAKHLPCRKARRIMKTWWLGKPGTVVNHNGGSGYAGWVTLKKYPGWRCTSGSGGGGCKRGRKLAGYQN
jgi:hypothetical protein